MSTKGREQWEKYKAGYVTDISDHEEPSTGNTGRDLWNVFKKTVDTHSTRSVKSQTASDEELLPEAEKEFSTKQYAKNAGSLFLNGVAEGFAATGAAVENQIGKVLDKLFPGAGFEGSGLFNALYNGRPDWKWVPGGNGLVGIKQDREYNQQAMQENAERIDNKVLKKAAEFGGDIAYGLGNAAPMAAEALATGGASVAAALTKEGLLKKGAEVIGKSGVLNTLSKAAKETLTSKEYWTSFASEVGMDYYDALDNGATDDEALRYALFSAGLNSVIEIGGGIQNIPEKPTFKTWLKSAHEEGMEEIEQGVVSRLLENAVYNKGNPFVSATDESAVFNPVTALGEYAGGAAVGGILSGGQQALGKVAGAKAETEWHKNEYGGQEKELLARSEELTPGNALAGKLREKVDAGKNLSGGELKKLIRQNVEDARSNDRAWLKAMAAERLAEYGEVDNVEQVADAVRRQVTGEKQSPAGRSAMRQSLYGERVANEIAAALKGNEEYNSGWMERGLTMRFLDGVGASNGEASSASTVTGATYNPETGKLDAIVTDAEGKVETKPLQEAEPSPLQEELFDWSDSLQLKEAGPLMINAYRQEQQNVELYARSFKLAYEYGKAGMPMDYVNKSEGVSYLSDMQRTMAYEEGQKAARQAYENAGRSGGTTSAATAKKPSVSLRGATVGGKTYAPVNRKTVDARQWASVKAMRAFSKVTGIDVVFYQSQVNAKGEYEGANGFYKDGTLYLDINAGRNTVGMTETAVLKTAAHELTHFIQQNSRQYEELKKFVVERLVAEEGASFEDLVTDKQRRESGLDYNEAVDEVVADACEMMLKDSTAAERLAKENRSLAQKIRDWLREWVENLKTAIEGLQAERTESKAMMQYAQELQKIWDDALVDAARNNRGAAQEVAPAEIKRQARVETSESINPDEKPLKGKRDDDKMGAVKASLKEDLEDGKARKEERGAFLRRATGEGIRIFEGDTIAYGYRPVRGESAGGNARQIQKELKDLGIDSEIFEGDILWNLNGVSGKKVSPQSVTVEKKLILINTNASVAPKNTAGHEAFHLWGNSDVRDAYVSEVEYNLNYTSEDFVRYQSVIANAYLGGDVDLSDTAQLQKLREELFAYISGDIHEGVNDDLLRPMFHDYDAVKAAWVKLCKDRTSDKVRYSLREEFSGEIDAWRRAGMPEGERFTLGSTGPVLQGLGAIESDIYMEGDKIRTILQEHPEMTLAEIKNIPQILEDPAVVLKSKTRGYSLVVLGTYRARNGKPILAAMDLRPMEKGFVVTDMQKVASAYTKTGSKTATAEQVARRFLESSDVLFVDKKRAAAVLRPMGISAPMELLRNGYIGSISYKKGFVNIQGMPFSSIVKIENASQVQNQQRELRLSDRAVLLWAAEKAVSERSKRWSIEDLNRFDILVKKLKGLDEAYAELETLKEERTVQLAGRKEAELKGEERFELNQTKNRIQTQKDKIQRLEADTYRIESIPQMKELLRKSRSIVEAEASYKARREYIERREAQEEMAVTRRKVERTAKRLTEYMTTNTDKKHIPEPLKKPIGELLEALDFSKKKSGRTTRADLKYIEAMQDLQAALAAQRLFDDTGEGTDLFKGYVDLPAGFESLLAVHVEKVKNALEKHPLKTGIVRAMDIDDLKELDVILSVMSRSVTRMNEMFVNRRFALVSEAAENSIDTMSELGQHQDKTGERFMLWDNTLPWYAFQRFGEGGKAVFEGLQDGWDKLAFNMKTVLDFRKNLIKDALARKWDTEKHRVELTDPDGATVTAVLTTTQLMSLHCLSKRKQALGHLLGGGIRPSAIELTDSIGDRIKKRSLNQDKQFKLTEESLAQLLGLLTPEQVKIADAMQKFMTEQGSLWGNEVTMIRFGYRGFTEQNYFPIETDSQDRQAKTGDAKEGSLYRLQNISAVKPLVKNANNALVLRGIFDVFANHTADMAKYNALVLPILDAQKWYNYKYASKNEAGQVSTRTVQRAMTKAYGGAANNYVIKYLQDLNGVKESGDRGDTLAKKMISNYKRAMVAANMRVALLQPTAYARASAVLDYEYLAKAFADKTSTKQAAEEMLQHSGIALWKSLGFFDTDVGRSIRDQIKGKSSKLENIVDKTMVPAEKGDEITWARLWRACKLEVRDRQTLTGDELLKATAERFREVVYRTQVVDSTMTRSHTMRSNGTLSKMATSFMSEPTVSYNMVMESTRQTAGDAKRLGMRVAIRRHWMALGRSLQAYVMSAAVTAIVESLYDALRDPDDDEYMEKVWKAFGGEKPETAKDQVLSIIFGLNGNFAGDINPIGKVPYLRDVVSILGGYSNGRMDTEAVANLKKAIDIWDEAIRLKTGDLDKATKTTYYGNMTTYGMIYPTAKALSQLTGLPASAAMREVATAWNSTAGTAWPELKMRAYENKKLREAWEKYGKDSGISYTTMYRAVEALKQIEGDKDADGNTISGSQKAKYLEYIRSLGLPSAQQRAVWEAAKVTSWSDSGTPWG